CHSYYIEERWELHQHLCQRQRNRNRSDLQGHDFQNVQPSSLGRPILRSRHGARYLQAHMRDSWWFNFARLQLFGGRPVGRSASPSPAEKTEGGGMTSVNLRIVDDSPADRTSMRIAFERTGLPLRLHFAASGRAALDLLSAASG